MHVASFCKNKKVLEFAVFLQTRFKEAEVKVNKFNMDVTDPSKIRTNIQFCVSLGKTPSKTRTVIKNAVQKPSVCHSLVYKWHKQFFGGPESVTDDQ